MAANPAVALEGWSARCMCHSGLPSSVRWSWPEICGLTGNSRSSEFSRSTARVSSPPSAASKTARSRPRTERNRVTSASDARRAADWLAPKSSRTASTEVRESCPRDGSSVLTRRTA
uniref:Uncharacterized protein n=1 Tax=Streptomyces coelicolor (strain ATCC BAA-471 / A3(2) / M145) TaxID=100226 RepID=Q9RGW4_STRCO|nr:unknown [Streptomyces coelicolor A3(2)]